MKFGLIFFFAAISLQPAYGISLDLNLQTALLEVDRNHPQILAKRQELYAVERELSAARQQRLPSLSISTNRSSTEGSKTYSVTRIEQPIFAGGRINAGINQAEARIELARASLDIARRDLTSRTVAAFHEIFKGEIRLEIAEKSIVVHEQLLDSIGRRVGAEVSPENELMLTRSRLAQVQTEKSQVQQALDRAKDVLQELIGATLPALSSPPRISGIDFSLIQAISDAEAFAPEIRQIAAQELIASTEVDLQRSVALPRLFVRYENLSSARDPGLIREQAYLGLEYAPGAGLATVQRVKAAENLRLSAIESRRAIERDIRERVRSAWSDVSSLRLQLRSIQNYVDSSKAVSESFARQFSIGRKTWLEVLNATREYLQAELAQAEIEWNLRIAEYRLAIETGRLTLESAN